MKIKAIFLLLFFLISGKMRAQENYGGGVDQEKVNFGFHFKYISSEYKIQKISNWRGPFNDPNTLNPLIGSPLVSLSSPPTQGFGLGFVSDYKIGTNMNLRFTPGMIFSDAIVDYEFEDSNLFIQQVVQGTMIDFPLGIKIKSNRRKNFRAYVIGGAKYTLDIISKKKRDDSNLIAEAKFLKNTKNNLWYEAGIGFDLYFEFFKMSPEIKFSQTRRSVLLDFDRLENPYVAPIDKLFIRNIQFSLFFE
jgi:hypothetical protein